MRYKLLISFLVAVWNLNGFAQEDAIVERSFLIVKATTDYSEAQKVAQNASEKLNLEYELKNDCWPDVQSGFECEWECDCGETHEGYVPRGRTDGRWVSVEHSNAYNEFTDGFFLVVVANGNKEDVVSDLSRTKEHFQDAYVKAAKVYVGCTH